MDYSASGAVKPLPAVSPAALMGDTPPPRPSETLIPMETENARLGKINCCVWCQQARRSNGAAFKAFPIPKHWTK